MNKSPVSSVAFALLDRARELHAMPHSLAMKARLAALALLGVLLVRSAFAAGLFIYVANAGEDTVSKIDVTFSLCS